MRKHYKLNELVSLDQMHDEIIHKIQILNNDAKKHNENLPGMGGVFNVVNLHVYHYGNNNPIKYIDPDGRDVKSALQLIKKHREKINRAAEYYSVDPVGIASVIFQEKYHGIFAEAKNWIALNIFDGGDVESGPDTRSYGLAEMQLKLAGEFLGIDPKENTGKTRIYEALLNDEIAIELIAKNIVKNETEMGRKLKGYEAGFAHNMGVEGYRKYLSPVVEKKNKPSDRVPTRSKNYQHAIQQALEGNVPFIIFTDDQWNILDLLQPKMSPLE